jgi:hypothetical protein
MEELLKIANILRIPIEKTVTFSEYVEIISGNQNVGSLPYITTGANINVYDTSDAVLTRFRWDFIYSQNQNEINQLIYTLLEKEEFEIKINLGIFRNLYVRDTNDNLICGINCSFISGEWTITRT